jgi:hypothetical protein
LHRTNIRTVRPGKIVFTNIASVDDRLGGQEEKAAQQRSLVIGKPCRESRPAGIKVRQNLLAQHQFGLGGLVAGASAFL